MRIGGFYTGSVRDGWITRDGPLDGCYALLMLRGALVFMMSAALACGAAPTPLPVSAPREEPAPARAIVVQLVPMGSEVSAYHDERHIAFGGVRVELAPGGVEVASETLDQSIATIARDQDAWYFLTGSGAVYTSPRFLGSLVLLGQFDTPAAFGSGSLVTIRDGNGRLYRARQDGFDRVVGLDQHLVFRAQMNSDVGTVTTATGGLLATRDGSHWYESNSPIVDDLSEVNRGAVERVELHMRTWFRASLLNREDYRYLGGGVFASLSRIISPTGERLVPNPPDYFERLYRLSDGLLGGLDYDQQDWRRLRVDVGRWERVDFPATEIDPLADDRTITDGHSMLWACESDVVCWLHFDDLRLTKVPIMNWLDHPTIAMGGSHAYAYSEAGRVDIIDLESGTRRPVTMASGVRVDVAATLLDGALLVEPGDEYTRAYRLRNDGSVRIIELPEPVLAIDFSPHALIGAAAGVREGTMFATQDEGRSWAEVALPPSAALDELDVRCEFETCRSGNVVLSLEGTFPESNEVITVLETPAAPPRSHRFEVEWECQETGPGELPSLGDVEVAGDQLKVTYRVAGRTVRRTAPVPSEVERFVALAGPARYRLGPSSSGVAWVQVSFGERLEVPLDLFVTSAGAQSMADLGIWWVQPASDGSLYALVNDGAGQHIQHMMPDGTERSLPVAEHMFIEGEHIAPAHQMGQRIGVALESGARAYDVEIVTALHTACPSPRVEQDAPLLIVARGPLQGEASVAGIRLGPSPCTEFAETRQHRVVSTGQGWAGPGMTCTPAR